MTDDEAIEAIRQAILGACPDLVTSYVAVIKSIDPDTGEGGTWIIDRAEADESEVLGLLAYADARIRSKMTANVVIEHLEGD